MPAYHSSFNPEKDDTGKEIGGRCIANMALLPVKTSFRGPAPKATGDDNDIIDETMGFFKANVFFKSYEVKGSADRVLIYLTLYISECLKKLQKGPKKRDAEKQLQTLAVSGFDIPGDSGFPLNEFYAKPSSRGDQDQMRQYITQLRQETSLRLVEKVYGSDDQPSKWWICFTKKKFMDKSLSGPGK
ncbi:actin-related protein 2/3 complex subunit 3-like [Dysidea avara]|uniref:actin-related protein 2/3 complex subunit 3-like n=1 Tax=Dysidea avara TaxID=196820 RepID=UPI0033298BA4